MSFGSTWRKWNLHIHTPDTVFNNLFTAIPPHTDKWETYLELLSKCDASVLGITDYFSINGYEKVKEFKDNGGLPNVELLIPNIELRIIPVTAGEKGINFHILCDPEIVDQLDNLLFNELKYRYKDNDYRCTKDGLIALGRAFRGPTLREEAAYEEGAHQFKVQYTDLAEIYRKSKVLREHSIRVVSNNSADGASGLQHNSLAATREEIYRLTQAIFSAQPKDRVFFLGKGVLNQEQLVDKYGSLKPCIHGCDAHKNEEICRPDLNRFTFIKADPTFSGLKQIIFEPESRVAIRDSKPRTPAKSINTVELNFPSDCKMDDEKFCFGNSYQLNFSPNFTCIIGGRGTGKSTLLNLIGAKLQKSANEFFRSRQLKDNKGTKLQITDCIKIDGDHDEKNIEFLSQNEIEDFAKDPVKLTNAIYSRIINLDTEDTLKSAADSLQSSLTRLKQVISHTLELREGKKEVDRKKKEIESLTKMTNSFESDEYKKLTKAVASSLLKVNNITYSQTQYYGLIEKLEELVASYRPLETDNEYITAGAELTASLNTIIDTHRLKDFSSIISQQTQFKAEYDTAKSNLQSYLQNAGVSTEDQKDITNANATIARLKAEVDSESLLLDGLQKAIDDFNMDEVVAICKSYQELLTDHIEKIQQKLDKLNTNKKLVKTISLKYDFDYSAAWEQIIRDFQRLFEPAIRQFTVKAKFDSQPLEQLLFHIKNMDDPSHDKYLEVLEADPTRSNAKTFLKELFSDPSNFELFKLIIKHALHDYFTYKKILVYYDGKSIDIASFGQRCTAALVILLLLGNNPIIIDEPEAHLDSMLISNYLVEVIKTRKNERQIIFATHNANFVINGDAELIHILEVDDHTNLTIIKSTTIENDATRDNLVALEGGHEAFQKREHRYSNTLKA